MTTSAPAAPTTTSPPSRSRLILIMVSLVLALVPVQLDGLVTATATPTIAGELGGLADLAWVATAYLLTMAIGTIVAGRLGDMFGRKWMFLIALGSSSVPRPGPDSPVRWAASSPPAPRRASAQA